MILFSCLRCVRLEGREYSHFSVANGDREIVHSFAEFCSSRRGKNKKKVVASNHTVPYRTGPGRCQSAESDVNIFTVR